jgi:hypothetical protein
MAGTGPVSEDTLRRLYGSHGEERGGDNTVLRTCPDWQAREGSEADAQSALSLYTFAALPASTLCFDSASIPAVSFGMWLAELGQRVTLCG